MVFRLGSVEILMYSSREHEPLMAMHISKSALFNISLSRFINETLYIDCATSLDISQITVTEYSENSLRMSVIILPSLKLYMQTARVFMFAQLSYIE